MMMIASSISAVLSYSLRIRFRSCFLILPFGESAAGPRCYVSLVACACGGDAWPFAISGAVRKNSVNTTPAVKAGGQNAAL